MYTWLVLLWKTLNRNFRLVSFSFCGFMPLFVHANLTLNTDMNHLTSCHTRRSSDGSDKTPPARSDGLANLCFLQVYVHWAIRVRQTSKFLRVCSSLRWASGVYDGAVKWGQRLSISRSVLVAAGDETLQAYWSLHARHIMPNIHMRAWACYPPLTIVPLSRFVCIRSRHAECAGVPSIKDHLGTSERSVARLITSKVLKEARHCQSVLRASFPSRSSSSEVQAKRPVGADTHRHPCWTDAKSWASPQLVRTGCSNLRWRWNGKRQTNRAKIKRRGPLGSGCWCTNASVKCDPRQNKAPRCNAQRQSMEVTMRSSD